MGSYLSTLELCIACDSVAHFVWQFSMVPMSQGDGKIKAPQCLLLVNTLSQSAESESQQWPPHASASGAFGFPVFDTHLLPLAVLNAAH